MPLYNSANFLGYVKTYRTLWIRSRYGSGKTALAFRIAHELKQSGAVRYIVSNVKSPWADNPADVALVNGRADVVLIMDEGGMFMSEISKARRYLSYLRKLNVILIIPSVQPPSSIVRYLQIKRTWNLGIIGLPLWVYKMRLMDGDEMSLENVFWWRPSEIFGLYDTEGYPSDDNGIEDYILEWTGKAAASFGYEVNRLPGFYGGFKIDDSPDGEQVGLVESLRGVAETIEESSAQQSDAVSLLLNKRGKRRG